MRGQLRTTLLITLAAMTLLTTGCSDPKLTLPDEPKVPVSSQVTTTSEFTNSNYGHYFYSNLDGKTKADALKKELKLVEGLYTIEGRKAIYENAEGDRFFISGYMPISVEYADVESVMFREGTGFKMFGLGDYAEEDLKNFKQELTTRKGFITGEYLSTDLKDIIQFNANQHAMDTSAGAVVEDTGKGMYAINLAIFDGAGLYSISYDDATLTATFTVDPIVSEIYTIDVPYSKGAYTLIVDSETDNTFYSAKYVEDTGELFVPEDVVKHILGWDFAYNEKQNIVGIMTNDIYFGDSTNYNDNASDKLGFIKEDIKLVTKIDAKDIRTDEAGLPLKSVKGAEVVQTGTPTPPAQAKPNQPATSKPTTSKPAPEKPKPTTPAPTYTNIFGTTYVCDGKKPASGPINPPSLPPSDGDRWVWNMLDDEWFWSDREPDPNAGQIIDEIDSTDSPTTIPTL